MISKKLIGDVLIGKHLVTENQVNEALEVQKTSGKPLGNILVELGYITSELITQALHATSKIEEQLAQLLHVSSDMITEMKLGALLKYIIDEAARIIEADRCTLYLVDEKTSELRSFIAQKAEVKEIRMPLGKGIAGFVAKTGNPVNLEDAYKSPLFDPSTDKETGYNTRTVLCIPLKDKNYKVIGALQALNKKGDGIFNFNDEWLFKSYGNCAANAISMVLFGGEISAEAKAEENIERMSFIVENIPDGIIIISKLKDLIVVNNAARWLLGFDSNKALDKESTIKRLKDIGVENVQEWLEGDKENLLSREITIRGPELKIVKIDFAEIGAGHTIKDKKGLVAILKDITKEKELERIKSEFINIAAHEFISPITSIKNAISLLVQGDIGPYTKIQKKFLNMIQDSTEYLAYLTTALLDLSLIETNKMRIKPEKVDLGQLVERVVENTQYLAEEKKISILVKDGKPPPVLADPYRTRQSMLILLDNAYKFTSNNGDVVVDIRLKEGNAEFSVSDNGVGIPLEEQEKIFEKFYQIEDSITRENHGMGLGLSICKDIVDAQGGRLWVESKKGEGSRFVFTLPLY